MSLAGCVAGVPFVRSVFGHEESGKACGRWHHEWPLLRGSLSPQKQPRAAVWS